MKILLITLFLSLFLIINSCNNTSKNSSTEDTKKTLIITGQIFTNSKTGDWRGINISRSVRTKFIFQNNSITSINSSGYLLQAGDEGPRFSNNNLDGEVITGNKFNWNGTKESCNYYSRIIRWI